jgi:putative DNA primase/helicase
MKSITAASSGPEPVRVPVEDKKSEKTDKLTPAQKILKLVEKLEVDLFHTPKSEPFARFYTKDHWENWPVRSQTFREWLSAACYRKEGFVPSRTALWEATNTIAGRALYDSREERVHVRLAAHNGTIYLDLCNESWEGVRITKEGWDIVSHPPIKFIRAPSMLALPRPVDNGEIDDLRPFLNLADEDHWKLVVGWLIGALRPDGPFPLLIVEGTHGSAKSTASRFLRGLIDPNTAPLRSPPGTARDLAIAAGNSWCLGFDNLSGVKPWLSDAFCRLSTGSGFSTRALYTDDSEKIFEGMRPVLLNGIDIGIERADLLDRAILVSLYPISEEERETEANLMVRFEAVRASILGGLLDAIVCSLRRSSEIKLSKLPRMADFAIWVCAAEPALRWPEGSFLDAYDRNRAEGNTLALEAEPLVGPLTRVLERSPWRGTATELLNELNDEQQNGPVEQPKLPYRSAKELSQALRLLEPSLRQLGITVEHSRTPGNNSQRIIAISKCGDGATVRR